MSQKLSTAALASCKRQLKIRRRGPRHPAGRITSKKEEREQSNEKAGSLAQALIAVRQEGAMNSNGMNGKARKIRQILPVILRITFCLALWTLGAISMTVAEAQTRNQRVAQQLPVNRARVENLQRWVNSGHDTWCRDSKSVAAKTVQRISPELANYDFELASLSTENGKSASKAVYTFHSLDGYTSYRITLRRFGWQNKTAGSPSNRIWIPVRVETITSNSLD